MEEIKVCLDNLTDDEREQLLALVEKGNKGNKERWKPQIDEYYWCVDFDGRADFNLWGDDETDRWHYFTRNCFKTKEEAEFHLEELKVEYELKDLADKLNEGWTPNWENCLEEKNYAYYDHHTYKVEVGRTVGSQCNDILFKNKKLCQKAIDTIGEDRLKKYYFNVKE